MSEQGMEQAAAAANNRAIADRRRFTWRTVAFGFLLSRRRQSRREDDREALFTDWHHPWLFFLAVGTMILSSVDAFFTLQLLDRGAVEVNPVMAHVIGLSTATFAVSKMLMTSFGVLVLVYLARSRVFNLMRTGAVLTVFFSLYCCLVCYEFLLLLQLT